LKQGN